MASEQGLYVYAFLAKARPAPISDAPPGVTEHDPLQVLESPNTALAVLYEQTPLADWVGPEASERLSNIEWVGPRALRHEAVIQWAHENLNPIFPASLGTIFSSPEALQTELASKSDELNAFFAHVADCDQWTVKGYADMAALEQHLRVEAAQKPKSGADYLRRRAAAERATGVEPLLEELSTNLYTRLNALAADHTIHTGRSPSRDRPVLHWHFLVPRARRQAFDECFEAEALANEPRGLTLHLAGPTAPYAFRA